MPRRPRALRQRIEGSEKRSAHHGLTPLPNTRMVATRGETRPAAPLPGHRHCRRGRRREHRILRQRRHQGLRRGRLLHRGPPDQRGSRVQITTGLALRGSFRTPGTGTPSRPNPFVTRRSMAASAPWERRTRKPPPTSIRTPGGSLAENSTCSADAKAWRRTLTLTLGMWSRRPTSSGRRSGARNSRLGKGAANKRRSPASHLGREPSWRRHWAIEKYRTVVESG